MEKESYIKSIKYRIPRHNKIHHLPEFAFDPGGFVRDPSKIIAVVSARALVECLRTASGQTNWSWMADKRGEVAGRSVEMVIGIQSRLPTSQRIMRRTAWRFGKIDKSKDRSKISRLSTSGDNISLHSRTRRIRRGGIYHGGQPCTIAPRGSCRILPRAS